MGIVKVNPLTVGPILGETTDRYARLWGRSQFEHDGETVCPCMEVARIRTVRSSRYRSPQFFRFNPNFDMTGVTIFHDLQPEQTYEYQMGWLFQDGNEFGTGKLPVASALDWSTIERHRFHTAAEGIDTPRRFVCSLPVNMSIAVA